MIRSVKDQGLSINEISRRQGISRTTFRRYLKSGKVPQYHRDPVGSMIEPFLPLLREVIDQHNLSAVRIYKELMKKTFRDHIPSSNSTSGQCEMTGRSWQSTGTKTDPGKNRRWTSESLVTSKSTGKEGNCKYSA